MDDRFSFVTEAEAEAESESESLGPGSEKLHSHSADSTKIEQGIVACLLRLPDEPPPYQTRHGRTHAGIQGSRMLKILHHVMIVVMILRQRGSKLLGFCCTSYVDSLSE